MTSKIIQKKLLAKYDNLLKNHKVGFIVEGEKEYIFNIISLLLIGFSVYMFLMLGIGIVNRILSVKYKLFSASFWYHITIWQLIFSIVTVLLFIFVALLIAKDQIILSLKLLFGKRPVFIGTDTHLIILSDKDIIMIKWHYFNPSTIIYTSSNNRGDLHLRLYYKENVINDYNQEQVFAKEVILARVQNPDEIAQFCQNRIKYSENELE